MFVFPIYKYFYTYNIGASSAWNMATARKIWGWRKYWCMPPWRTAAPDADINKVSDLSYKKVTGDIPSLILHNVLIELIFDMLLKMKVILTEDQYTVPIPKELISSSKKPWN